MARRPRPPSAADLFLQFFNGLNPRSQKVVAVLVVIVVIIAAAVAWYEKSHPRGAPGPVVYTTPGAEAQMAFGNPSRATADSVNRDNYLMQKPYFALSYNDSRGGPNWVSWQVRAADIAGNSPRKQVFDTDTTLPPGFRAITHRDYVGSGFDRGHMCPHSDRDATKESSEATFVMTNIIPQAPELNQHAWANLENYCRDLVRNGNELFVISGPLGEGGEGLKGQASTIAQGRVTVPAWCWKVIVVVPAGERINGTDRVISVLMPNRQGLGDDWKPFLCTPAEIEQKTGYRFFDALPAAVASDLRSRRDSGGN